MHARSVISLFLVLLTPAVVLAQEHVVSTIDLHNELAAAATQRQKDIAALDRLFSSDAAQKALAATHTDAARVRQALPLLSDQELARLASQARLAQSDFAGSGLSLTTQQVTYIIIGVIVIAVVAIIASH